MQRVFGTLFFLMGIAGCLFAPAGVILRFHCGPDFFDLNRWLMVSLLPVAGVASTYAGVHLIHYSTVRSKTLWRVIQFMLGLLTFTCTIGLLGWALIVGAVTFGQLGLTVMTVTIAAISLVLLYLAFDVRQ